jgi:hypothetical protein
MGHPCRVIRTARRALPRQALSREGARCGTKHWRTAHKGDIHRDVEGHLGRPVLAFCHRHAHRTLGGNHVALCGLLGGAEGIRTSDLRGAGGRSPEGGAAPGSARLNSEGAPPSALVSPTLYLRPLRPSDPPRRPRRGNDGCLLHQRDMVAGTHRRCRPEPVIGNRDGGHTS